MTLPKNLNCSPGRYHASLIFIYQALDLVFISEAVVLLVYVSADTLSSLCLLWLCSFYEPLLFLCCYEINFAVVIWYPTSWTDQLNMIWKSLSLAVSLMLDVSPKHDLEVHVIHIKNKRYLMHATLSDRFCIALMITAKHTIQHCRSVSFSRFFGLWAGSGIIDIGILNSNFFFAALESI